MESALQYAAANREAFLAKLMRLLAQPSISAQNVGLQECAEMACGFLREAGFPRAEIYPSPGHPFVYAECIEAPDAPTILFYGHYDVQPANPEEWESPPFVPTIRNGRIYARGAGDNKGQWFAHVAAVEAYMQTAGRLPVNVKLLLEGEEENGSPHVADFIREHRDLLRCDLAYTSDGPMQEGDLPTVLFGVRGMLSVELESQCAKQDYHSGNKGGLLPNPAWRLIELLSAMRDKEGRVLIPGFYDGIIPATAAELESMARIPYDREAYMQEHGLTGAIPGYPPADALAANHRLSFEPTLNICGFQSGYGGAGIKTIIPSVARVKIDMRLCQGQDPADVYEKFVRFCQEVAPDVKVIYNGAMLPSRTSMELPVSQVVIAALRRAWDGQEPVVRPTMGGSLPDYVFTGILGVPSLVVPYANADENNHGPNENIRLACFEGGIRTTIQVLEGARSLAASATTPAGE